MWLSLLRGYDVGGGHTHKEGKLLVQDACCCVLSSANTRHHRLSQGALLTLALTKAKRRSLQLRFSPPHPCAEGGLSITVGPGGCPAPAGDTGSARPTTAHHSCRPPRARKRVGAFVVKFKTGCPQRDICTGERGWTGVHRMVSRAILRSASLNWCPRSLLAT